MPTARKHYVARVTITRVTKTMTEVAEYNNTTRNTEKTEQEVKRDVQEIAALTFSEATPKALSDKIAAHIALITDVEA